MSNTSPLLLPLAPLAKQGLGKCCWCARTVPGGGKFFCRDLCAYDYAMEMAKQGYRLDPAESQPIVTTIRPVRPQEWKTRRIREHYRPAGRPRKQEETER
jgi:hypothetical protein